MRARSPTVDDEWTETPVDVFLNDHRPRKEMSLSCRLSRRKLTLEEKRTKVVSEKEKMPTGLKQVIYTLKRRKNLLGPNRNGSRGNYSLVEN